MLWKTFFPIRNIIINIIITDSGSLLLSALYIFNNVFLFYCFLLSLDSTFATKGYIASTNTHHLWLSWVYLCIGVIFSSLQARVVLKCLAAIAQAMSSISVRLCLQIVFRLPCPETSLTLKLVWVKVPLAFDLTFLYLRLMTVDLAGCLALCPYLLILPWKVRLALWPQMQVFQGEPASALCRWYLFAWHAHKEINATYRTAESGRCKGSSLGHSNQI